MQINQQLQPEDEKLYPKHMHGSKECTYYIKNAAGLKKCQQKNVSKNLVCFSLTIVFVKL